MGRPQYSSWMLGRNADGRGRQLLCGCRDGPGETIQPRGWQRIIRGEANDDMSS